jgi:hypothetical protein
MTSSRVRTDTLSHALALDGGSRSESSRPLQSSDAFVNRVPTGDLEADSPSCKIQISYGRRGGMMVSTADSQGPHPKLEARSSDPRIATASEELEGITSTTAHCTIVATDIAEFGQYSRNNTNQVRIRRGMYRAMQQAFDAADIPWISCRREDRGDGVLILAPADVSKAMFVDHLPNALVDALTRHNRIHPVEERIRLRLALHAGEVNYDEHGVTGSSITHTFRLLDAEVVKRTFAEVSAVLAIIGSAWFFDEVIRHSEWSHARSYRPVDITNKETTTQAWIRLLKTRRRGHSRSYRATRRPF